MELTNGRSYQFGSDSYEPFISSPSLGNLKDESECPKTFELIILKAAAVKVMRQLALQLRPFISPETNIFVGTYCSIFLENEINRLLPNTPVFTLIYKGDIKCVSRNSYVVNDPFVTLTVGHSSTDSSIPEVSRYFPRKAYEMLSTADSSTPFMKFLAALSKANGGRVYRSSTSSVALHIWANILNTLVFDCMVMIFNEFDPQRLFFGSRTRDICRNLCTEITGTAGAFGYPLNCLPEDQLIARIEARLSKQLQKAQICHETRAFLNYPLVLYEYMEHQRLDVDMVVSDFVALIALVNLPAPSCDFLKSILATKASQVLVSLKKSGEMLEAEDSLLEKRNEQESLFKEAPSAQSDESSVDSAIQDLYINADSFILGDSNRNPEESLKDDKLDRSHPQKINSGETKGSTLDIFEEALQEVPTESDQQFSNATTDASLMNSGEMAGSSASSYNIEKGYNPSASYRRKTRRGDFAGKEYDDDLVVIDGTYYREPLPQDTIFTSREYTKSTRRVGSFTSFKKKTINAESINMRLPLKRRGYGPPKIGAEIPNDTRNESHILLMQHRKLMGDLSSAGYLDTSESRYGYVDSFSTRPPSAIEKPDH